MAKTPVLERKVELEKMTHPEVAIACKESSGIVVIPIGATEQHGPHLPLNTDNIPVKWVVLKAAQVVGVCVAPLIPYGNSRQNIGFVGTIAIRPHILGEFVKDICFSLHRHGFQKLLVVNGHGGNWEPLTVALEEVHYDTGAMVALVSLYGIAEVPVPEGAPPFEGHAGREETEVMLVLAPEDVDKDAFVLSSPTTEIGEFGAVTPSQYFPSPRDRPVRFMVSAWESTIHGHYGDPSMATVTRGQMVLDARVEGFVKLLRDIKAGEIKITTRSEEMPPH